MLLKIKVLIYFLFIGFSVISQNNSLVIFSASGNPFYVTFNTENLTQIAQSNVKIFDVNAGWSTIEIKMPTLNKELNFKDSILLSSKSKFTNKEFTYVLIEKGEKLELQFKSVSELSGPKTPPVPTEPKEAAPLVDTTYNPNYFQIKNNRPLFSKNYKKETSSCSYNLTDKDIASTIRLFRKTRDDESKYRYLNQIVEFNCFKASQLKDMIDQLSLDLDKLTISEKAYTHILDKENIKILVNSFKFDAVKESFKSFIIDQENIVKQKNMHCMVPISDAQFESIYNKIKNMSYDTEKLDASKKNLVNICLSSTQIIKWSTLFSHDREKLEFMNSAFYSLTDTKNAVILAEEFQTRENKNAFLKHISQE